MKNMFPEDFFEPSEKRDKPSNVIKHPKLIMNINPPSPYKNKRNTYYPIKEEIIEESITKSILSQEKTSNINEIRKKQSHHLDFISDEQQISTSGSGSSVANVSRGSQNNSNNIKNTYDNPIFNPHQKYQRNVNGNNFFGEDYFYFPNSEIKEKEPELETLLRETPHFALNDFKQQESQISLTKPQTPIIKKNQVQRNKTPEISENKMCKPKRTTSMNKLQTKKQVNIQTENSFLQGSTLTCKKMVKRPTTERFSRNNAFKTETTQPSSEILKNETKNLTPNKNRGVLVRKHKYGKDNDIHLPKILPHAKLENEINQLIQNVPENVLDDPELKNKFNTLMKNIDDIKKVIQRKNKAQNNGENKLSVKTIKKETNCLSTNRKISKKENLFQTKSNCK